MTPCWSRPRLRRERMFRESLLSEPAQAAPFPRQQPAPPARESPVRLVPSAKQPRSSRALARRPPQPPSRPPQEERAEELPPPPPAPRAKQSRRVLPLPSRPEVDCSRPAPVMIPPTALEANSWWVPRGALMREEPAPQAKQSRAVPILLGSEVRRSRPALVMVALMAVEANWWSASRGALSHGKLPPRVKARLQELWAEARPEVQLL